ncbi:MAG: extracellular solute-binding protein [bacterium]|nr:extracellular solute-binding protein [bacterium]
MKNDKIRYQPLYMQVKGLLLKRIVNGDYKSGEVIPGESALARDLETSVYTVRQAISLLVADGVLTKKQGKRTFVTERKIRLSFFSWIPETKRGEKILSEVIALYQKRNPSIEIECIPTNYPTAKNHLTQLIANGEAPDVVQIASVWTSHFASMGALEPLEPLLNSDNLKNRIYEKDLAGGTYHRKLYSVAWGLCSFALIFHKTLLRQAGIQKIPFPLSLEALHDLCRQLENVHKNQEFYSYGLSLSGRQSDFIRICAFLRMFDGGFTDEQGDIVFNSPQNAAGFHWLKDFVTRFNVFRSNVYTIRERFAEGAIACISDAPWVKYQLEEVTTQV